MIHAVLLTAAVTAAIKTQPSVKLCLVERRVVVARALQSFSCFLGGITLNFALLAFDAVVALVSSLAGVAAAILVPHCCCCRGPT